MERDDISNSVVKRIRDLGLAAPKPKNFLLVLIALLVILIICTFQSCSTLLVGGIAGAAGTEMYNGAGSMSASEYAIYAFFKDKGYGDVQIAAILGNLKQENDTFDPTYDSGNVLGIMQWTGSSRTAMVNWCNANGLGDSIYTLETQLRYAYEVFIPGSWHFPSYSGSHAYPAQYNISYDAWLNLTDKDIDLATGAFCACSEKPYYIAENGADSRLESARIPYAREYLARIKAGTLGGSMAYVAYAVAIANDDSHGYDQQYRDGNPDYDCSSLVSYSLRAAGYAVNVFDTSCEGSELTGIGFQRLPYNAANLRAGDILWRPGHTEIYIGNGQNVGAHCNEFGGIMFGKPGDQTGREINVSNNSSLWEYIYRVPDAPAAD